MADNRPSQAGSCFLSLVYTWFRIPEPSGRTFAELDVLFEHRVPARKFATTKVDVWHEEVADAGVMHNYQETVVAAQANDKA